MCPPSSSKPPKAEPVKQTPPPPPPEPTAEAPVIDEGPGRSKETASATSRRRGKRSLRIDLNIPGPAGTSGLAIPTAA